MSHLSSSQEPSKFQEILPQLAFLLVTALFIITVLLVRSIDPRRILYSAAMVLESLGFPWSWPSTHGSTSATSEKRKGRRRHAGRVRTDHPNGSAENHHSDKADKESDGYFPGLVNISGTYCFMNATIQAMASLCYLQPHIDAIHSKAVALDMPSPVIDALRDILHVLNTASSSPTPFRPSSIISALSNHSLKEHSAALFSSREHQDAQELFQLLSECIKSESAAVDKEGHRDRGLGELSPAEDDGWRREIGKSPFDGLTANRRSCLECGYTEAVMHFAFDNWQLAVSPKKTSCTLEECLSEYTRLEVLTDCVCRKCSMRATHERLSQEADKLAEAIRADPDASQSKKRRAKEARRLETRVKNALDQGRIEDEIKGVKMDKVFSKVSTKQAMIARPPPILALHINRSMHYGQYAAKNPIRIIFPEVLDLTPFTTSGNLSTVPSSPISSPPPRSATPTPATYALMRTIYRLSAVVCHYGQHSFGHYVCFRRKPRPESAGALRFRAPRLGEGDRDEWGWLRVSDDAVRECTIAEVLAEGAGAFMLYYERVVQGRVGLSPKSSEETLKPEMKWANGSSASLASSVCEGEEEEGLSLSRSMSLSVEGEKGKGIGIGKVVGPRVVRSVATSRGRSQSVGPGTGTREEMARVNGSTTPVLSRSMVNGHAKGKGKEKAKVSPHLNGSPIRPNHDPSPDSPKLSHASSLPPPQRIETPLPVHPPAPGDVLHA